MTMIRVTVGNVVTTWSPEYGFTVAGGEAIVEEIEPRETVVNVPVLSADELDRLVAEHRALMGTGRPSRRLEPVPIIGSDDDEDDAPGYGDLRPEVEEPPRPARRRKRGKCLICNHPMHEPEGCTMTLNLEGTRVPCDCATPAEAPA